MTTNYTPGPWTIGHHESQITIKGSGNTRVCALPDKDGWSGNVYIVNPTANARLIAASPTLLDACKDALWFAGTPIGERYFPAPIRRKLEQAISLTEEG